MDLDPDDIFKDDEDDPDNDLVGFFVHLSPTSFLTLQLPNAFQFFVWDFG